jgi:predicted small lipoprotein YifL
MVVLALCGALASCGQKGPLYLPEEARDIVTRPTQSQTAPTAPGTAQPPEAQPVPPEQPPATSPPQGEEDKQTPPTPPR